MFCVSPLSHRALIVLIIDGLLHVALTLILREGFSLAAIEEPDIAQRLVDLQAPDRAVFLARTVQEIAPRREAKAGSGTDRSCPKCPESRRVRVCVSGIGTSRVLARV